MKFLYFVCLIAILSIQFLSGQEIEEDEFETKQTSLGLLLETDKFTYENNQDTIIINYNDFIVTKAMVEVSEDVTIFSKENHTAILHTSSYYFLGLINNRFAIFEAGTTTVRDLMIYDLNEQREILNTYYHEDLSILNNAIYYKNVVQLKEIDKPKCPPRFDALPYIIYLETKYFDFRTLEINITGIYNCSFSN